MSPILFSGPCGPGTAAQVRRALAQLTPALTGAGGAAEDLALVLSELVSNAVNAGARAVEVLVDGSSPNLRVAVTDDAEGIPLLGDATWADERGRGLAIVQAISSAWGYTQTGATKSVWADIPR